MKDRKIDSGFRALVAVAVFSVGTTLAIAKEVSAQTPSLTTTEVSAPRVGFIESRNLPYVVGVGGLVIAAPFIVIYAVTRGFRSQ